MSPRDKEKFDALVEALPALRNVGIREIVFNSTITRNEFVKYVFGNLPTGITIDFSNVKMWDVHLKTAENN